MSVDYFLKLDGIIGDSKDEDHFYEIEIASWHWGDGSSSTFPVGEDSQSAIRRMNREKVTIVKRLDRASPALSLYWQTGQKIQNGQLTVRETDTRLEYLKIWFMDLLVESLPSYSGVTDRMLQEIVLKFTKFRME